MTDKVIWGMLYGVRGRLRFTIAAAAAAAACRFLDVVTCQCRLRRLPR